MGKKCEFIKDDGVQCGAWSLKESPYCRIHHAQMLATIEEGGNGGYTVEDFTDGAYFDEREYCDGRCESDAAHYLVKKTDHWIFVINNVYPARTGPDIQWCPFCGRELEI